MKKLFTAIVATLCLFPTMLCASENIKQPTVRNWENFDIPRNSEVLKYGANPWKKYDIVVSLENSAAPTAVMFQCDTQSLIHLNSTQVARCTFETRARIVCITGFFEGRCQGRLAMRETP